MRENYLICYDIKNEKRLSKVYKYLCGIAIHIQYSVFYHRLDYRELIELKEKLKSIINEEEDDLRIYPLPSSPKVLAIGQARPLPEGVELFLK